MYSSDKQMHGIYRANVVQASDYFATVYIPSLHRDQMPFINPSDPSAGVAENSTLKMSLSDYPKAPLSSLFVVFPLEVGDAVWVTFENGDANYPVIMGRLGSVLPEGDLVEILAGSGGSSTTSTSSSSSSASSSGGSSSTGTIGTGGSAQVQKALEAALSKLGAAYVYGEFDCSRFVQWCYEQAGVSISRTTATQMNDGQAVNSLADIRPGDLIIWSSSASHGRNAHVVMVLNDHEIIQNGGNGKGVNISDISYAISRYNERPIKAIRRICP